MDKKALIKNNSLIRLTLILLSLVSYTTLAQANITEPLHASGVVNKPMRQNRPVLSDATQKKPQRIISLAPFITELAFSAGLGNKLVAASAYSDYPEQASHLESVSDYQGINLEEIIALDPDLILVWPDGVPNRDIKRLKQLNYKLYTLRTNPREPSFSTLENQNNLTADRLKSSIQLPQTSNKLKESRLQSIATNIEALSVFAEDPNIGLKQANDFRSQLALLKTRYHTEKKVRYFYQVQETPLKTFAQNSWPSDVFEFCGGENIFDVDGEKENATPYPTVGIEQVIALAPDVIFAPQKSIDQFWPRWKSAIPALQKKQLWSLNPDWLTRPTMRTLSAIKEVCGYFEQAR